MKTTKRALFSSVIALILCFSMLVGTTFAWFTDSVESGVNHIIAGTLDIELFHTNESVKNDDVAGETALFVDKNGKPIKWEPGAVAYEVLTVENKGTLALKYQLSVNFTNENTVNGYGLSQILKIAVVDASKLTSREAALAEAKAATNAATLRDFTLPGKLDATTHTSDTYGIVIWWEPSANDNNWNVNNGKIASDGEKFLHIDLGIKLVATQVEGEFDSFGPDYDEDAWADGFEVVTAEDLQAAINNGETNIKLMDNIETNETIIIPEGATVALNLNGNTISSALAEAALVNNGVMVIANGTIESTAANGGNAISNKGTLTLAKGTNVIGAPFDKESGNPAYTILSSGNLTIEDGVHVSAERGCLYLQGQGETVINGGTFTNADLTGKLDRSVSAHVVYVNSSASNKLTINGGTFAHNFPGTSGGVVVLNISATTVTVNGGNFSGGNYYGKWDNLSDWGYGSTKTPFVVTGGSFTGMDNKYVADGYKALQAGGMYYVVADTIDSVVSTAAELATAIANSGVVYVADDIDMANAWTSVKPNGELTIIGNGNTITNLNLPLLTGGVSSKVTISGLTVADSTVAPAAFENGLGSGAFIPYVDAYGNVTFEDCHIKNSTINGNERAAGLVGYTSGQSVTIKNCSVENCEISAVGGAAGLVAYSQSVTTIENCSVKNTKVTATEDREGTKLPLAGAVIGTVHANTTLTNVTVSGNTVSNNNATAVFNDYIGRWVAGELTIDGAVQKTASSQSELNSAVSSDDKVAVELAAGNYTLPSAVAGKEVTISGSEDTVIDVTSSINMGSGDLVFDGVTVLSNGGGFNNGIQHVDTIVYQNATIVGSRSLYGNKEVFINCTFDLTDVSDYIWVYGANEAEFINCTFNTNGKALLIYNEGDGDCKVTVKGCTFNATTGAKAGDITNQNCAAIEIYNFAKSGVGLNHTLITEGNTINGDFSGEWRIKNFMAGGVVTVNGVQYTKTALDGELMTVTNKVAAFD